MSAPRLLAALIAILGLLGPSAEGLGFVPPPGAAAMTPFPPGAST